MVRHRPRVQLARKFTLRTIRRQGVAADVSRRILSAAGRDGYEMSAPDPSTTPHRTSPRHRAAHEPRHPKPLPPHPLSPSQGERVGGEGCRFVQAFQCACAAPHEPRHAPAQPTSLPLPFPRGEGRGEGSVLSLWLPQKSSAQPRSPYPSMYLLCTLSALTPRFAAASHHFPHPPRRIRPFPRSADFQSAYNGRMHHRARRYPPWHHCRRCVLATPTPQPPESHP